MKKILGILVLGIFIGYNPLSIKFSYAGLLDIFKSPLEICMDRLEASGLKSSYAAQDCSGSTRATLKCMDRLEASGLKPSYAAQDCTGKK